MENTGSSEMQRLQKKLIPLNIVIAVISLVAAFTLFFMPFLKIDCGKLIDNIAENVESGSGSEETSEGSSQVKDKLDVMLEDAEISISTYSLAKTAFKENVLAELFSQYIFNEQMENAIISNAIIYTLADPDNNGITQEQLAAIDIKGISDIIDRLETEKPDDVSADLYAEITTQCKAAGIDVEISESDVSVMVNDLYDMVVENTENGNFTKEAVICILFSELLESESVCTTYEELIDVISDSDIEDMEEFSEIMDMLQVYVSMTLKICFAMAAFPVLIWFILFLFSFLHIFAKNKRFTMWYAKLFGAGPCIIFWLIPVLVKILAPNFVEVLGAEMVATLTGVLGAVSSMAWISGICYLLMWLISIFWAFPIKRKIRKLLREA